ncbi:hypothetical protein CIPAW_11G121100 [Carya illinoinensis]|nr:hypothetical protein CIPAW_11G121100 [Carya illinoinensis]
MWNSLLTCCKNLSFHQVLLLPLEPRDADTTVYRDELEKKASRKKLESSSRDHIAYSKLPISQLPGEDGHGGVDKKEFLRVKVKMTKQEAARMLSKCKDGGLLEFKDVALELAQIPINRVSVVSPNHICDDHPVLRGIPEELEN